MKIVSYIQDNTFNYKVIPWLLKVKIKGNYSKLYKLKQLNKLISYLESNFKLNLNEILNFLLNNLHIYTVGRKTQITINNELKIKDINLDMLIRLIDYGNIEVKGIFLIKKCFEEIQSELRTLYKIYLKGGFENEY